MHYLLLLFIAVFPIIFISTIQRITQNSYRQLKVIKGEYFSKESLCSGFLNDIAYDISNDSCQIPCYVNNTILLITSQEENDCGKLSDSISFDGEMIYAKSHVTIKQHKIINKIHYENQQLLKV